MDNGMIETVLSRDDYRLLFNQAEVAITLLSSDMKFIECNDAYFKLFGYEKKEDVIELTPNDISPPTQPDGSDSDDKSREMVAAALKSGSKSFEWAHRRVSGDIFLSLVILDKIRIDGRNLIRATIKDISEQKKLERLVEERTQELINVNLELERLALTDDLTGLANRVKLKSESLKEYKRFRRYQMTFGVIMLDVDHFKKINDTYGHLVGDQILIELSSILESNSREVDTVARWGGEEFIVLFPNIDLDALKVKAEKLRRHIEFHNFNDVEKVTASFGIAVINERDTPESFFTRLDTAMYEAKNSGRNKVCTSLISD